MSWTPPAPGSTPERIDQGKDYGNVRQGLVAVAAGIITQVYQNLSGFGQTIIERIGNRYVYYGEETSGVTTTVHAGEQVAQGQSIASGGSGGGIEVGFWNPATGHAAGYVPGVTSGGATPAGRQFASMLGGGSGQGSGGQITLSQLWIQAGGDPRLANIMAAIAMAESSGQENAVNHDANGTTDYGLWQINSANGYNAQQLLSSPLYNAQAAVAIEKAQGLGAWTTYQTGAYRQFLGSASKVKVNYGGPNGGMVRPGGATDTGAQVTNLFDQYYALRDMDRTAPPAQQISMTSSVGWFYSSFVDRLNSFFAAGQGNPSGPTPADLPPPSTTPGRVTTPGVPVPPVGGIGHRNTP